MPFLTPEEIHTHLYGGVVDEISRDDDTILQTAIDAAISEVLGYLTAYDTAAVFNATGSQRNAILLLYTKDCAVWHYIQLANPHVEMELRLTRYEKAIDWLKMVQSGKTNPALPYPAEPAPSEANNYIKWGSNVKRNNNF